MALSGCWRLWQPRLNQIISKKYVNVKRSALHRALSLAKDGCVSAADEPWGQFGRKPILNDEEVDEITKKLSKNPTEKFTKDLIRGYIQAKPACVPACSSVNLPLMTNKHQNQPGATSS